MLLGQRYISLTEHVILSPKPGTKHFAPVSCKRLQKFHTGLTSYRSEFVPVSCKYPLTLKLRCKTAYFCSRMGSWEAHPGFYFPTYQPLSHAHSSATARGRMFSKKKQISGMHTFETSDTNDIVTPAKNSRRTSFYPIM